LLLFDRVFSELFARNFNPQFLGIGLEVGLKLFLICSLEMVVGPFEREVLTHESSGVARTKKLGGANFWGQSV